jgi:pimeloyl-ACP methyl ester carboxylesterase
MRLQLLVVGALAACDVVFLYGGSGQGSEHFEALGGRFLERELRIVYFDQRGSGLSERPVNGDYAIATMVDDIEALRRDFGTPKIVVMGHSFGAVLALEYAAKYPTTTSQVIIVAGVWDLHVQCPLRLARFAQLRPDVYARVHNDTLAPDGSRRNATPPCAVCRVREQRALRVSGRAGSICEGGDRLLSGRHGKAFPHCTGCSHRYQGPCQSSPRVAA